MSSMVFIFAWIACIILNVFLVARINGKVVALDLIFCTTGPLMSNIIFIAYLAYNFDYVLWERKKK